MMQNGIENKSASLFSYTYRFTDHNVKCISYSGLSFTKNVGKPPT